MLADIAADPTLSGLTSTSKRAIYRLLTFILATAINILESLIDIFTTQVETIASTAAPASAAWLQNQMLLFQYNETIPQIIQLINFAPAYPTVNTAYQIISRASVVTTVSGQTLIKVATGNPPQALTSDQLSAAQSYVDAIGATINYVVTSANADELYIGANVYYQGQYSAIIQETVINAINALLAALTFNGTLKLSDIELAIRAVPGVNDVILTNVKARTDGTSFADGTYLIQDNQVISRTYSTVAGYLVSETTTGDTLADSLTFIAQ